VSKKPNSRKKPYKCAKTGLKPALFCRNKLIKSQV